MAKDIAALTSDDKAAFKAALAGMGYMKPIPLVQPTYPVPYYDIVLPTGYKPFALIGIEVELSSADVLAIIPSVDAGATFLNTPSSYTDTILYWSGGSPGGTTQSDQVFDLGWFVSDYTPLIEIRIYPGSVTRPALTRAEVTNPTDSAKVTSTLNAAEGRINLIRLMPYGNADNPPTSGRTLTAGTFYLLGVPTP